ncbi:MAG TPA: SDR family oxidoreductase [Usitatibacter sp.]|nr:SDR family oxidoreductase [Usitatibacter sp.]
MKVFITGASSGIGAALARHYGARGATLGLLARREAELRQVGDSARAPFEAYACDVRDLAAVERAAREFTARHGTPDIVIANAGISHGTSTEREEDVEVFREILEINVMGMVNAFHPFVAAMRERGSGTLAGIASVAGFRGLAGAGAYSASKAAAIRYLEALRVELRGTGVRVTTVCPGYIRSPMTAKNPYPMPFIIGADDAARRMARAIDAGRSFAVIPWPMAIVGRLLALLPNALFDPLTARGGRKPRR